MNDMRDLLPFLTPRERGELDRLLKGMGPWVPLPGPQTTAYHSKADIIGYGGAAGGGKTDLACGMALTRHRVSAIFRREATQLTGVVDRLTALLGNRNGYNGSEKIWRLKDRQIEFGSTPHPGDETRYQGRPKDLLVVDEATNFLESQVRFLMGWVRTTIKGQKCTTLLTFNPPTSAEGQWVMSFFAPWLEEAHPHPAAPGELRWFAVIDGRDVEVPDDRPFVVVDGRRVYDFDAAQVAAIDVIQPQTRTFIPSSITDNPFLVGTGYMQRLQAMPEPLRSQMLRGDFRAGLQDDRWQVIPTSWVRAAQERWTPRTAKGPMDSMGVDVSRGGDDETVTSRRHDTWFDDLVSCPGVQAPDGPTVAAQVITLRRDRAPVHIDMVGWGSSPYDFLKQNGVQTIGINGAAAAFGLAKENSLRFINLRAETWWRMREALDPKNPHPIALPPDPQLRADLCALKWELTQKGIKIEGKEDIIARLGRSPDRGDAVVLANITTAKEDFGGGGKVESDWDPFA